MPDATAFFGGSVKRSPDGPKVDKVWVQDEDGHLTFIPRHVLDQANEWVAIAEHHTPIAPVGTRDFQNEVGAWGVDTFPDTTDLKITRHLFEELGEIVHAIQTGGNVGEELADAYLMLLHLAHRNRVDLHQAARDKFDQVKHDEWEDDGRGYRKRVKRESV